MYVPVFNALEDATEIRGLVAAAGSAELVTVGPDGYPTSTLLPVVWDGDRLVFHMARANPQWRTLGDDAPALAVVTGPQAYVSASWYPSKTEHGRMVPTWNYSAVHLSGRASVRTDEAWLREAVTLLTDRNEEGRADRWRVTDAPADFVTRQLRAVVGIEVRIERVEAKAKLSQNRSAADHAGVVAGLRAQDDPQAAAVATAMDAHGTRATAGPAVPRPQAAGGAGGVSAHVTQDRWHDVRHHPLVLDAAPAHARGPLAVDTGDG